MAISAENTYDFQEYPKAINTVNIYSVDNTSMTLKSSVKQNTKITISNPNSTAVVIRPFFRTIEPSEMGGYLATNSISNGFELEAIPSQARESCLKSLVDDLIWLQERKEKLSPSILEELHLLQHYIRIVQ